VSGALSGAEERVCDQAVFEEGKGSIYIEKTGSPIKPVPACMRQGGDDDMKRFHG